MGAAAIATMGWIIIVMISPIVTAVRIGWNFFMVEPDSISAGLPLSITASRRSIKLDLALTCRGKQQIAWFCLPGFDDTERHHDRKGTARLGDSIVVGSCYAECLPGKSWLQIVSKALIRGEQNVQFGARRRGTS